MNNEIKSTTCIVES